MEVEGDTYGKLYEPAMAITDPAEAQEYFYALVRNLECRFPHLTLARCEEITRINLGYFAGYYGHETRERVERLYNTAHPVFGKISDNGPPTMEEAMMAGVEWARPVLPGPMIDPSKET